MNPQRCAPRAIATWGLASAMAMSGCSTSPLVSWNAPPISQDGGVSLGAAKAYARSARAAYQKSLEDQVSNQSNLAAGLLGLGVLSTAAALARSHRDVFSSFALAGGTGYAFGQQNLRPERMRLMVVGIEALNCALAVVTPLDISERDLSALSEAMAKLNIALANQQVAVGRARDAIAAVSDGAHNTPRRQAVWEARLTNAEDLQRAGAAAQAAARSLRGKSQLAGRQLVNTVDRVRTQVDKAALETMPDLSAVTASVASLGDFAGRFAPNAKLDARIKAAMEAAGTAQSAVTISTVDDVKTGSKSAAELDKLRQFTEELNAVRAALRQLDAADRALQVAASAVTDDLTGLDPAANTSALPECKAAGVSAPLAVTDDELQFAGGKEETLSFIVSGGVKPYSGVLMTGGSSGVTLRAPVAFDTRFDVTVAATVKSGSFNLLVQDHSTPTPKLQTVKIVVGKATAAAVAGPATHGGAKANWYDTLVIAFNDGLSFTTANGHTYTVLSRDAPADELTVTLKCTPKTGSTALDSEKSIVDKMVETARAQEAVQVATGDGSKKVRAKAPPACMKPA